MTSPRQTVSFLRQRFDEVGLHPETRHGQNFLIDLNLVDLLVDSADLGPNDVVLEVGTGTGSLTSMMASLAARVVTVEIDTRLYQMASEELVDFDNVTMFQQDVLKNKNTIEPNIIDAVCKHLEEAPGRRFKLAANLPYNIATPLITNLLLTKITPDLMTVTIQKELADRMMAKPRTKDYSSLSIFVQSLCEVELVRIMPPTVFWPRPKVDSAIINIKPNPEKRERIPDLKFFHTFVRSMFFHRRKYLRSVVISAFKGQLDKPAVDEVLNSLELGPTARAEELDIEMMFRLCEGMRARVESAT